MAEELNGGVIRYSAKELFERIDGKLDVIDAKLDEKIGRSEFEELKTRVGSLEARAIRYAAIASTLAAVGAFAANHYF